MTIFKEVKTGFNNFVYKLFRNQEWQPYTEYNVGDVVKFAGIELQCIENHTSDKKFDDNYWKLASKRRIVQ